MKKFVQRLLFRHQIKVSWFRAFEIGIKGLVTITLLVFLNDIFGLPLLMAPFGASTILVYTTPHDEFSQPINIICGYFICGLISLVVFHLMPHQFWVEGIVLGLCIPTMALLRVTHPPAGAVPIVVYFELDVINFWFLVSPILCGSLTLVAIAILLHRNEYPRKLSQD